MDILNILWPQEIILRIIIAMLWIVAIIVVAYCFRLYRIAKKNLQMLDGFSTKESIFYLENSLRLNNIDYAATFTKFEEDNGKNGDNEAIFEHLKAIYDAGNKSSRLDADLLVKNTIDKIFIGVDTVKTFISVFLVIGILGTLLGLGSSIASFSGDSFVVSTQGASSTAKELSNLFKNLRGAFAPSIWGVFFTIVSVVFYTWFIQERCINKLTDKLTINTIKVWLPSLYPTDFQKGENSMIKLKETINNADKINDGTNDLLNNLNSANETIISLNNVSEAIKDSANKFTAGSDKIAVLEQTIEKLSGNIRESNENFQQQIKNAIDVTNNFQNQSRKDFLERAQAVHNNFNIQNEQLANILHTLKSYDEKTLQFQSDMHQKLLAAAVESVKSAERMQHAIKEIENRNMQLTQDIGVPLNNQLNIMSEQLTSSLETMTQELKELRGVMGRIQSPLTETAMKIQEMFDNILRDLRIEQDTRLKELKKIQASAGGNSVVVQDDEKLDAILDAVKSQERSREENFYVKAPNTFDLMHKWAPVAICIILFIGIVLQGMMLQKIGSLEQSQNNINQMILKGDKR
mgnify:CR=1 FL=1